MKHGLALSTGLSLIASLLLAAPLQAETALFSADGYRLGQYRSPTPAHTEHARTLDTPAVQRLLKEQPQTQLIDFYRRPWLHGQFIEDQVHANLPGSLWLANTGDGELSSQWQNCFSHTCNRPARATKAGRWCSTAAPTAGWAGTRSNAPTAWVTATSAGTATASTAGSRPAWPGSPHNRSSCRNPASISLRL